MRAILLSLALVFSLSVYAADGDPVHKKGIYTIVHADREDGVATYVHVLHENNGKDTELEFPGRKPERGAILIVDGVQSGKKIKVKKWTIVGNANISAMTGLAESLYMLVNFTNNTAQPFTQAAVEAVAQTNANSVKAFFTETSYGQYTIDITVTPWMTLPMAQPTNCDYTAIANAANTAATTAGYNLANYKFKMYVFPVNSSCAWIGLAYLGSPYYAFSNGRNSGQVYTHEQGHNHGLDHAGTVSGVGAGQSVVEYGDTHDTMGNSQMRHYNSMQKVLLGWITGTQYFINYSGAGTYTLAPFETPGGALYAVKIPTPNANRTYWLEYRRPVGIFDAADPGGVQLRLARPFETTTGFDDTHLLTTIAAGSTYTDATYGISVNVGSADATGAVINITAPALPVSCTLAASRTSPVVGTSVTLTDTCTGSPTTFAWTNCTSTTSSCTVIGSVVGAATYSVTASNGATSDTDGITVNWVATAPCTQRGNSGKCK